MTKIEFTRKIDALGRVLIPAGLRRRLGWDIGDMLSLSFEEGKMIACLLEKQPTPECVRCKSPEREVRVNGKDICANCLEKALEQII